MDNTSNLYNEKIILLVCSFVFIAIYAIYLIPILVYIFKNILSKKLCVYWIDYSFLIASGIIFIITFIIKSTIQPIEEKIQNIEYKDILTNNIYYIVTKISLNFMCLTIISSLFFDSIIACKLSYKMNKIKKINDTDYISLSEKLKNINIVNMLTFKFGFKFNFYFFSIPFIIICTIIIILCYLRILPESVQSKFKNSLRWTLRWTHLCILILLILSIIIMISNKKVLLRKNYYSRNRIAQKIYNVYFNQIIYFTDIISFKLVSDLIMNIPVLLFLSHFKFNIISLLISEFAIFIYIFLGGCEYLIIDKNSKAAKINKALEYLFCMKYLDFHFGEKDHSYVIDQFKFNYTKEEQKIMDNLNMTIIKNIENNIADLDERENRDEKLILNESTDNIFDEKEIKLEFKTIQEFYLIQKLMMSYFNENKKLYELNTDNNNDDSYINLSFSLKKKKKNKIMNEQDKNNYLSNIAELSRKSILDSKKIKSYLKLSNYNMFYSIREKELYEELKTIFNIKNEKNEFIIENIFASKFFELFPFYQMNINLIINSLEPSKNIKIFNKFANRNKKLKIIEPKDRFSVMSTYGRNSNIKNEENEEYAEESISENNLYYTNDLYLMYEIYNEDEFNSEKLNNIISEYNKYLLSVIKNINYTFLPIILGIFHIEIFHCKKIIILYRNPLYFTNYINLNRWINFFLTEESEKIKLSTIFNDIIDMNEDEIKSSLQIGEVDYEEIVKILENDFNFIKKIKNIYPMIHIFLGEESNTNDSAKKKIKNKNQFMENSLFDDSLSSSQNILDAIDKDISYSYDNIVTSEDSLFEKEYYYMIGNNIKSIKLYFTNLFRNNCKLNHINANSNYCKFMKNKIFNYLTKNSLFTEEKNEKTKDEKDDELD